MRKSLILFLVITTFTLSLQAQEKSKNAKARFEVKGNCEMCKERIEKAALHKKGVKYAVWNVDTKEFYCIYNENKTSVNAIKKAIADVGHDTDAFKAADTVYENLPECCLYRDGNPHDK